MNGYSLVNAVAVVCVSSLAALTFAAAPQDQEVGQSGATRPVPPAMPTAPSVEAVPADGGPLQSWSPEAARRAAGATLDHPIVHRGIPGDQIVDGVYAEPSLSGQTILRDLGTGTRPVLPVDPLPAPAGYLSGCPCTFGTFENEPDCGFGNGLCDANSDTTNGGCNMAVPAFSPITLGETYCSTAYYDGFCRDTDWYEFTLAQPTRVTWRVTAEFDVVLLLLGDGTGNCPKGVVAFALGAACTETSLSATLPAGTWSAFVAADFAGPSFACGAQYTATLLQSCEMTLDEGAFDAANPGLTVEDFEDGNAPAAGFCGAHPTPWTSATVNSCLDAGDIAPGLAMDNQDGTPNGWLLGAFYAGGGQPLDNIGFLGEGTFQAEMVFSPTVTRVGLEIEHAFPGAVAATIEVYGPGLVLYDTIVAPIANSVETFVGITCAEPIAQVRVLGNGNGPTIMSVAYGNEGEGCEVILSESEYDARFPNQTLEDFEDANVAPNTIEVCGTDPATSAGDGGGCFDAGDIEVGLSVGSDNGSGFDLLGAGFNGYASNHVGADFNVPTVATFAGGVRQCGLRLVPTPSATTFTVEAYDPGGGLLASFSVPVASAASGGSFVGIACNGELIGRVEVFAASGFQNVDDIRFGNEGDGCIVYASSALFDTLYPDLDFEDFEDSNVVAGGVDGCAVDPVGNAGDGGVCFDAGDIEPGLAVGSDAGTGVALVGPGFGAPPSPSRQVSADLFTEATDLIFSPPVRQVGTLLRAFSAGLGSFDVTVFGTSGDVMFAGSVAIDPTAATNAFWGIACNSGIARVRIDEPGDGFSNAQFVDDVRFGTSKRNLGIRYCSPNLPNSTGDSGIMIVTGSNVDADDDLTLTAMQLPTNSNIGYFLMGTGTNSFIPTGAGSFICVAPGLKRYLPPVNNTNQFPGGFDRVVGTQGNGHPISVNITPGSTWNFQAWHRDSNAGTSHFTDAVSVTFQ